jgi:hypothetical protein
MGLCLCSIPVHGSIRGAEFRVAPCHTTLVESGPMKVSTFQELQLDLKHDLRVLVRRMEDVRRGITNFIDADFVSNGADANVNGW